MTYEGASDTYNFILDIVNYVFTGIFALECFLKIGAMGTTGYWINNWNKFDLFVVLASFADIIIDLTLN